MIDNTINYINNTINSDNSVLISDPLSKTTDSGSLTDGVVEEYGNEVSSRLLLPLPLMLIFHTFFLVEGKSCLDLFFDQVSTARGTRQGA